MTLHLFTVIVFHSSWPVQVSLNFILPFILPSLGLVFRKNQGSDRWPPPLWSVPHMATLFPGYLTKHLEIMDMKKLSFKK